MKNSKIQRKFVNSMRQMGDVPWPARRFKSPPTFSSQLGSEKETHIGHCKRVLGETTVKRGKLRRKKSVEVRCGGKVYLRRATGGTLGKRRVYCEDCRARKRQRLKELRIQRQLQSRFGIKPFAEAREDRSSSRLLAKFRRTGSR